MITFNARNRFHTNDLRISNQNLNDFLDSPLKRRTLFQSMAPSHAIPFSPPADQIGPLFAALFDPARSLADIAAQCNTSLESLAAFTARPDIQQLLLAADSAAAQRTRLLARAMLPRVLDACSTLLQDLRAIRPASPAPAADVSQTLQVTERVPTPATTDPLRANLLRLRAIESTRRVCALIIRLTHLPDSPQPSRPAPAPKPPRTELLAEPSPAPTPSSTAPAQPSAPPARAHTRPPPRPTLPTFADHPPLTSLLASRHAHHTPAFLAALAGKPP